MEDSGVGIIEFELTRTADMAEKHYEDLGSAGREDARAALALDYAFLVSYGLFLIGACAAMAERALRRGWSRLAAMGPLIAWGALGAAVYDAVENTMLLLILEGHTQQPWPGIAFGFA
ncbi:MAG: hypothetical protein ACRDLQ_06515, partial [Solirubrobacterales bacterium]